MEGPEHLGLQWAAPADELDVVIAGRDELEADVFQQRQGPARRCCGSPKFPTLDHRNSPGDERRGRLDLSLRGCQGATSCSIGLARAMGLS